MRVNIRLFSLYVFSLVIMWLAGVYFGSILYLLLLFFVLLPFFSLVAMLYGLSGVSCEQAFSLKHPVKGQAVTYRLLLTNTAVIPAGQIELLFENVAPSTESMLVDTTAYLTANGYYEDTKEVRCPYRGEYTVGLKTLVFHDFLRLFSVRRKVTPERFTVYPRVLELDSFAPITVDIEGAGRLTSTGMTPDTTLFEQLREYREGDSVRHIYWKKYASTGRPILKEYEKTRRTGVRIYFDLRRYAWRGVNALEQEDVSVESLVAIVRFFLLRGIHVSVVGAARKPYYFEGRTTADFQRFYESTAHLHFTEELTPEHLLESDRQAGILEYQTAIVLTHIFDAGIMSMGRMARDQHLIVVLNRSCRAPHDLREISRGIETVRRQGIQIVAVDSSESILRDLGESRYVYAS